MHCQACGLHCLGIPDGFKRLSDQRLACFDHSYEFALHSLVLIP